MASSLGFDDWDSLGEGNYRRSEVYAMEWEGVPISGSSMVAAARFAGPVACLRADRKLAAIRGISTTQFIFIYTSSGRRITEIPWTAESPILANGMMWTDDELLVCVLESGQVIMFDLQGEDCVLSILPRLGAETLVQCCLCTGIPKGSAQSDGRRQTTTGLVTLSSDARLYLVRDLADPQPPVMLAGGQSLVEAGSDRRFLCMRAIEPQFTKSNSVEVLLSTHDQSIVVASRTESRDQNLQEKLSAPVLQMAVAPNGRYVACFAADGNLSVMQTSFSKKVLDFDTKTAVAPLQLVWCGEDSVVLRWKQLMLMVGPFGHFLKYSYDEDFHVIQEIDCCRIVSDQRCELLQRVPEATQSIFTFGSTVPAAMLNDAMEAFNNGEAKAEENIRTIQASGQLEDAVNECISAALAEFDVERQQILMRAAAYGKSFCEGYDASKFVEACKTLRVLNAVRQPEIGLPLTHPQYERLTQGIVVARLIRPGRFHHYLALRICNYLRMPLNHILVDWACAKIRASEKVPDAELRDAIRTKLKGCREISYGEIAKVADQSGRTLLATMLLDYEPRPESQVRQLISMREPEPALRKAIESGDTELIFEALLNMKRQLVRVSVPDSESKSARGREYDVGASSAKDEPTVDYRAFFRILFNYPVACDLLVSYCKDAVDGSTGDDDKMAKEHLGMLKEFYYHLGKFQEAGNFCLGQAYSSPKLETRYAKMAMAQEFYERDRELQFHAKLVEEQTRLLHWQEKLEKDLDEPIFVDMSISETILNLLVLGQHKMAATIKTEFKVPDKRFYHLKLRVLSRSKEWHQLRQFAMEKNWKSPIGYRPFVDACIRHGAPEEAIHYIRRLPDANERIDLYMELGMWEECYETVMKTSKDVRQLTKIRESCGNMDLSSKIDRQLAGRR